ncbi:hypothetical protein [Lactococcus garvieae]|uniref:hypothetical protein n=1 Tax=Lactococcus garvieae TaxID=1363 RepID=UPI003851D43F
MRKKRKLQGLVVLVLALLLLISGTFAWSSFTQWAINDRDGSGVFGEGGRLHDYFDRAGNKDVFAENFGDAPILVRIKLLEYAEINGESLVQADPEAVASGTAVQPVKEDPSTWTPWTPGPLGNSVGDRVGPGAVFNPRAKWTVGWQPRAATDGSGQLDAPYFMPTFNHDRDDSKTATAGDGRDWIWSGEAADTTAGSNGTTAGTGATGVTHPGAGTDGFWNNGDTASSLLGTPPDTESGPHTARQTAIQDRPVMLLSQWNALPVQNRVGNFWVVDPQTGWAYWANMLFPEEATSFLLDQADFINTGLRGHYYYGIKAVANMVSNTDEDEARFWESGENHSDLAKTLIDEVRHGLPVLGMMQPGDTFNLRNIQYRYLENKGDGNHLVMTTNMQFFVPTNTIAGVNSYNGSTIDLATKNWYNNLPSVVKRQVQPVQTLFTGTGPEAAMPMAPSLGGPSAVPAGLAWNGAAGFILDLNNPMFSQALREDFAEVDPSGEKKAFILSVAEVNKFSGPGQALPTLASRMNGHAVRTRFNATHPWTLNGDSGVLGAWSVLNNAWPMGGNPAFIIRDQDGAWTP